MINKRFGSLVVVGKLPPEPKWRRSMWDCICDCGNSVTRTGVALRLRKHPSCGCVHPVTTRATHRKYGTVEDCLHNTISNGACLEWAGHRTAQGYAMLGSYKGKYTNALPALGHRRVFFLSHGYLPEVVMHMCDNPPCINPDHLKGGTKKDNSQDASSKGRLSNRKRKYKVMHLGRAVTLAEYSRLVGVPMATLQWRARNGKLDLVNVDNK